MCYTAVKSLEVTLMSGRITWGAHLKKQFPEPHPQKTLIQQDRGGGRKVYF